MPSVIGMQAAKDCFGVESPFHILPQVNERYLVIRRVIFFVCCDANFQLPAVSLVERNKEDDLGVGSAPPERRQCLGNTRLRVAGVRSVESVVGAVVDQDQRGFLSGLAVGTQAALGVEQGVSVAVDFVPATQRILVLATLTLDRVGDHKIARDVAGRIIPFVDPAAPTAGAHRILVPLGTQRLAEQVRIGRQRARTDALGDAVAHNERPLGSGGGWDRLAAFVHQYACDPKNVDGADSRASPALLLRRILQKYGEVVPRTLRNAFDRDLVCAGHIDFPNTIDVVGDALRLVCRVR